MWELTNPSFQNKKEKELTNPSQKDDRQKQEATNRFMQIQ
jgi:hypothetical protein